MPTPMPPALTQQQWDFALQIFNANRARGTHSYDASCVPPEAREPPSDTSRPVHRPMQAASKDLRNSSPPSQTHHRHVVGGDEEPARLNAHSMATTWQDTQPAKSAKPAESEQMATVRASCSTTEQPAKPAKTVESKQLAAAQSAMESGRSYAQWGQGS